MPEEQALPEEPFKADDIVKSCCKLESGLNLCIQGIRACTRGAFMPPLFCTAEEVASGKVTKDFIVQKRKEYIRMLNDENAAMDCKQCLMVHEKRYGDINFERLGHIDIQHYTLCNLRCSYCAYTRDNMFFHPQYDALKVFQVFDAKDVEWNSHVDFAGGEPTLLEDLPEYLAFFKQQRIRVLMFSNAIRFSQCIADGLADGSIFGLVTSIDAGTPNTFRSLRGKDAYLKVLENLSRYAKAGSLGKGMVAAKYIFCDENLSDDDIAGFAYAMLAIRPQQVWLTFDFAPMYLGDSGHDYTPKIKAYAKLFLLLKKHGLEAFHYYKEAISTFSKEGKAIMDALLREIEASQPERHEDFLLRDFRRGETGRLNSLKKIQFNEDDIQFTDLEKGKLRLEGKRVLLVPATVLTEKLLEHPEIQKAAWVGFLDRNPVQHGKAIKGKTIYAYEKTQELNPDFVIVAPPEKHRIDILETTFKHAPDPTRIFEISL